MRLWRISRATHAGFDGEGSRIYGSRWTPPGYAAVYASATLSLAALERLVHADPDVEADDLVAIEVTVLQAHAIDVVNIDDLPEDWRTYPPPASLSDIGTRWLRAARTSMLSVPSVVIPHEWNYVLNPAHPDFARIVIGRPAAFRFDSRLLRDSK